MVWESRPWEAEAANQGHPEGRGKNSCPEEERGDMADGA